MQPLLKNPRGEFRTQNKFQSTKCKVLTVIITQGSEILDSDWLVVVLHSQNVEDVNHECTKKFITWKYYLHISNIHLFSASVF